MKKILILLAFISMVAPAIRAQDKQAEFDKKFRFGLRITPQPTWFVSSDKNNIAEGQGIVFGFGFGLNMERRFSDIVSLLTGIGGDFEGGKYKLRYDPANSYQVSYWRDEADEFVEPAYDKKTKNTVYILKERTIKTTFATIPLILKLSTKEYSGMKYYGMFGAEVGFRLKMTAKDTYYQFGKFKTDTSTFITPISSVETTEEGLDVGKEGALIPLRVGLNAGIGGEYRLGGSTSVYLSLNFFRSFSNLMRKESDFLTYRTDVTSTGESYKLVKQNLKLTAIRINIGVMF
jgi:hypothetical protein